MRFPRYEEGNIDVKTGKYGTKNQPEKATFKYEQEGRFCLGVANMKGNNGTITVKECPFYHYPGKEMVTIDVYKKEIPKEFASV